MRFNPCRVFKSAATGDTMIEVSHKQGFNPCRVFKSAATASDRNRSAPRSHLVSIPVGFSSPLQLNKGQPPEFLLDSFQSLSGFQVRCNGLKTTMTRKCHRVSIPVGFSSPLQRWDLP